MSRISPIILLVIVIVAIAFFILGLLHLVMRCLMKRPSSISQSNRFPEYSSSSHTFQRQLQHLFRLHDSGLDQALIDSLPVFYYNDIIGLKEPFDCAVCLCEFSGCDKLKSIPNCSHAFHIHCIETWLLSNSTCPLCRGLIGGSENPMAYPLDEEASSCSRYPPREGEGQERVFCVRLGKFKKEKEVEVEVEVSSSSRGIDGRRCYSMGAFEYIVNDANLQVMLSKQKDDQFKMSNNADGYKINARSRGDSFSVSKIWLWSKT